MKNNLAYEKFLKMKKIIKIKPNDSKHIPVTLFIFKMTLLRRYETSIKLNFN